MCQFQVYKKVIQLYIYIYLFFFKFFSHLGYDRILNRVLCAVQQILVGSSRQYLIIAAICPILSSPDFYFLEINMFISFKLTILINTSVYIAIPYFFNSTLYLFLFFQYCYITLFDYSQVTQEVFYDYVSFLVNFLLFLELMLISKV